MAAIKIICRTVGNQKKEKEFECNISADNVEDLLHKTAKKHFGKDVVIVIEGKDWYTPLTLNFGQLTVRTKATKQKVYHDQLWSFSWELA